MTFNTQESSYYFNFVRRCITYFECSLNPGIYHEGQNYLQPLVAPSYIISDPLRFLKVPKYGSGGRQYWVVHIDPVYFI